MADMWIYADALAVGLIALVYCADRFVIGAASIARHLGVSPLIIGLTIVGFGTSAPEILVSSVAAWHGNTGLAVGNALGSNIANIGLILGVTALLTPVMVHSRTLRREMPLLLLACLAAFALSLDGTLTRLEGGVLMAGLAGFLLWLARIARKEPATDPLTVDVEREIPPTVSSREAWFWFLFGLSGLVLSSRLLVWSAVAIAHHFQVSDLVIGLTIVALGTSLPELAASLASVIKGEDDLVIGNIVGSNMFNMLAVFPMPGIIKPGPLQAAAVWRDFPWMLGFTVALLLLGNGWRRSHRIGRMGGALLVIGFCVYQYRLYLSLTA